MVRFVLTQLLDGCTRSRSLNCEVRWVEDCLAPERDPGFPRKCIQEALLCSFKTSFLIALQSNTKRSVDEEFAFTLHNMCGDGHDKKRTFSLCAKIAGNDERARGKQKKTDKTC